MLHPPPMPQVAFSGAVPPTRRHPASLVHRQRPAAAACLARSQWRPQPQAAGSSARQPPHPVVAVCLGAARLRARGCSEGRHRQVGCLGAAAQRQAGECLEVARLAEVGCSVAAVSPPGEGSSAAAAAQRQAGACSVQAARPQGACSVQVPGSSLQRASRPQGKARRLRAGS